MPSRTPKARLLCLAAGVAALPGLILTTAGSAAAAPGSPTGARPVPVPASVKALGHGTQATVAPALRKAKGTVLVSVQLSDQPLAATVAEGAVRLGGLPSKAAQQSATARVRAQQDALIGAARGMGARALGRVTRAANVVAMSVDAAKVDAVAQFPGVLSIKPVARYVTHADPGGSGSLAQAADYLGVTPVRNAGYDGTGVKVTVLDSGIDYTHANLGGPGTVEAYNTCYYGNPAGDPDQHAYAKAPRGICASLIGPTAPKVKGGYDFIGETWDGTAAGGPEKPDPNPIDFEGHGTHVSDIAAGRSADGSHKGIAPGADLYMGKVCSSVSTSCSGVGILEGIDWALDPNGDGDISDATDVLNLSLGTDYGQPQDDSTLALENAVRAGVIVVASAGNGSDHPFKVGSPSIAPRVISVAETALPDQKLFPIRVDSPTIPGLPNNTVRYGLPLSWAPEPTSVITGPLEEPTGSILGCDPADWTGFPAGAIAIAKRGSCPAAQKARNAQNAGAKAFIIWNNLPGDPYPFAFDEGTPIVIPSLSISLLRGSQLSAAVQAGPVQVTIDPAAAIPLRNTIVGSSSRGPTVVGSVVKPDIGAPGAWLSALVGTGDRQENFGGTSGAAPVVTGAAALVIDKFPLTTPAIVKSRLLNAASTGNRTPDPDANLYPTPVSRIGAGEVRVAPALTASGVLLNKQTGSGNISLGQPRLDQLTTYTRGLGLRNTGSTAKTYRLSAVFRDPADQATGAVTVQVPASVTVPAKGVTDVIVRITVDPAKLPRWPFTHSAGSTTNGSDLNLPEVDGYVRAVASDESLHLGWHVLPHRAADVSASGVQLTDGSGTLTLTNASQVLDGAVNVYGLTGTSPKLAKPGPGEPGTPGSNAAVVDLARVGVRDDVPSGILQFALAGWQRQGIPLYPAGYEVDVDTTGDGDPDYAIFQVEAGGFGATGQSVVTVLDIAANTQSTWYYTDADYNSSTEVFSVPLSALKLSPGSTFAFDVLAYDNYFTGNVTDVVQGMSWTVGSEKYSLAGGADTVVVPAGQTLRVTVSQNATAGPSSQTGLLLLYDDAVLRDSQAVRVTGGTATP